MKPPICWIAVFFFTKITHFNHYVSLGIIFIFSVIFFAINRSERVSTTVTEDSAPEVNTETTKEIALESTVVNHVAEEITDSTEAPVVSKPIKFIENPLPLPKKHVKKEMNYAFEPTPDQMHYDLNNYSVDDDYDLKDI